MPTHTQPDFSSSEKKPYSTPQLAELGQVRELTASGSGFTTEGAGEPDRQRAV